MPKCENFDLTIFTAIIYIWVGDLDYKKEFILNFEADICYFVFQTHAGVCAKNLLAQTQHAFKIDFLAQAQLIFSFMLGVHYKFCRMFTLH